MSRRWIPTIHGRRIRNVEALGVISLFLYWISQLTTVNNIIRRSADNYYFANVARRRGGDTTSFSTRPASYPIYILGDIAEVKFQVLDWKDLSIQWTSNSSYSDLLKFSPSVTVDTILPSPSSNTSQHGRVIIMLHNHPKMASTTLRRACWENLKSSCNIVSPKRDPMGYSDADDLASLIEQCTNTYHFCVGGWHYRADNFPNPTSRNISSLADMSITFLHMFPFRNFYDWADSALKQIFVGHSDTGCTEASKRLDSCNGWLELDFEKYSKRTMAQMIEIMNFRDHESQSHTFLLYDFREVQTTLALLSRMFHTPLLPYLDMTYKQNRREGSCPIETLQKFHDCFDEQLLQL
jgi:hypothetical protein